MHRLLLATMLAVSGVAVGETEVVIAPNQAGPQPWRPDIDRHTAPPPMPRPADLDTQLPITSRGAALVGPPTGGFTCRDVRTGEKFQIDGLPPNPGGPLRLGATGPRDDGQEPWNDRGFGTMQIVDDTTLSPARLNCQLIATFIDDTGAEVFTQCSGTLIDAETILTAAHCVYYGDRDGNTVNDLAVSVRVAPATHQGTDFFGVCNSTIIGASNAYIDSADGNEWGDFDYDIGIVQVSRAAGMLTGWQAIASGGGCGWILDTTYHNFSYPGETCGGTNEDGQLMHTGTDMYYWSGQFDSCPTGTQLRINTPNPHCFNTSWGGMSGSNAYFYLDGHRYSHAVCSNAPTNNFFADYCKLWGSIAGTIEDEIIPQARGSVFDLQALDLNLSGTKQTSANAFDTVSGMSFLATNPTNADAPSGNWGLSLHLSDNANVTASDTLLWDSSFNWNFDPMSSVWVTPLTVQIPVNTPTGTYWIGAVVDDGSTQSNNATTEWDALEVAVTAVSEVEAFSVSAVGSELNAGDQVQIDFAVRNNGADTATGVFVKLMASTNQTITDSDVLLAQSYIGPLGPVDTDWYAWSPVVPDELVGDDWYIGMIIEDDDDVLESNNVAVSNWSLPGVARPHNDDACDAIVIEDGLHTFDTTWATTDGEDHAECPTNGIIAHDIWYVYQSPNWGRLTVTTCEDLGGWADFDTEIAVYSGTYCGGLTLMDCNDDDPTNDCGNSPSYRSTVQVDVESNQWVFIRLGGFSYGNVGHGGLLVETKLPNDDCQDAVPIEMGDTWFTTEGATTDGAAYGNCQFGGYTGNDIWFVFTSPCTGTFTASTCDQVDYDSDLVLFQDHYCSPPDFVACNDDSPGCDGYSSILEAPVEAGVEYLLRVGGYEEGDMGSGTITLTCTPNESGGDVDGDGDTDIEDLLATIAAWDTDDESADVNGDGVVNIEDLLQIISAWTG